MLEQPVPKPATDRNATIRIAPEHCLHDRRRIIGLDETACYYYCDHCHETLADMGGILWHVRPSLISP